MSCLCLLLECQTLKITTQKKKYAQGKERYVKNGLLPTKRKNFSNERNTFNDHLQYLKIAMAVWPGCELLQHSYLYGQHTFTMIALANQASFQNRKLSSNVQHIFLQGIWIIFNDEIKSGPCRLLALRYIGLGFSVNSV